MVLVHIVLIFVVDPLIQKVILRLLKCLYYTEKEDLCAVIDEIKNWDNVDPDNIFLFGASQGGLITGLVADDYVEEIKGILLLFPALCIADDWNKKFPTLDSIPEIHDLWGVTLGRIFFETIHGYDVFEHIGKFNKNVLIFHGDQDEVVALKYGEESFKIVSSC